MRHSLIFVATFLALPFLIQCNTPAQTDKSIEQIALSLINNVDSNSLHLLKEYGYGRRGDHDFWEKLSADTTLYACSYKVNHDIVMLTIFRPLNFANDFTTKFNFDTSAFSQFTFFQRHDTIVKILRVDNHGQDHFNDTLVLTKELFPNQNPFTRLSELTAIKDELSFIGTFYRSDIGEFIEFWITPRYKLTYLPDSSKMNPRSKQYWLEEFASGKIIKEHWSLIKVY